ncbi:Hypothetical protein R9X50_00455300 [Acrodontium crateriforme]|uniref:DUF202 domain-containing protein n=1 Tax=Acrodontium crateriforme TaxID=150365 RepID=A0AAQ3R558_9PEZI|nr:Hypothetical protein R9X50_00455300 [Acrodontium crateriforme]
MDARSNAARRSANSDSDQHCTSTTGVASHHKDDHDSCRHDDSDDELEATELRNVLSYISANRTLNSSVLRTQRWYDPIRRFWKHHVRISVPHVECRDHLANERTFLAYLRTSAALSMIGIFIAQLYRLHHSRNPDPKFGYFVISKPLAVIFQGSALVLILLGAIRFFRQQSAMARGKVHAGGWEVFVIAGGSFMLLLMLFALHLGIDIYKLV